MYHCTKPLHTRNCGILYYARRRAGQALTIHAAQVTYPSVGAASNPPVELRRPHRGGHLRTMPCKERAWHRL